MIVVIDPKLKELFFDRIMEMCGNSPYQSTKWIESIAYGEKAFIISDELDGYIEKIKELEETAALYRKDWLKEIKKRQQYQEKIRGIDEEVESWMEEIEGYRAVLRHSGLGEYI
jgi:hypothetical protein